MYRVKPFVSLACLLGLAPALLAALLFASAFAARAADLVIDGAVTRTNNNVILDGDDTVTINKDASIRVNADSPNTLGGNTFAERNTGIFLRRRGTTRIPFRDTTREITGFVLPSSNNTITNNGNIIASGANSEGVHVGGTTEGEKTCSLTMASSGQVVQTPEALYFLPTARLPITVTRLSNPWAMMPVMRFLWALIRPSITMAL